MCPRAPPATWSLFFMAAPLPAWDFLLRHFAHIQHPSCGVPAAESQSYAGLESPMSCSCLNIISCTSGDESDVYNPGGAVCEHNVLPLLRRPFRTSDQGDLCIVSVLFRYRLTLSHFANNADSSSSGQQPGSNGKPPGSDEARKPRVIRGGNNGIDTLGEYPLETFQ